MSKRWDEAIEAAADVYVNSKRRMDPTFRPPEQVVEEMLTAFATAAHAGPAALRDWVEGRAVLVPMELNENCLMHMDGATDIGPWSEASLPKWLAQFSRACETVVWLNKLAASPAAPDGEPK